jgi:hypothetical protein
MSTTAHAAYDAVRFKQTLEVLAGVLGGFNWSSQHLKIWRCSWERIQYV